MAGKRYKRRNAGEEALNAEFYRKVIDGVGDAVALIDPQTYRVLSANRAFLESAGLWRKDVIGKTCYGITHKREKPCEPPYDLCPIKELLKTGKSVACEHIHFDREGNRRYVEVSVHPVKKGKKVHQIIHITKDITERKLAEEELHKERDFSLSLVQASPTFFVAIDAGGKTLMMNKAMLNALGYTIDEVVGKDYLSNFVPEADHDMLFKIFKKLIGSKEPVMNENRVLTRDGRELLVEWHGRPTFKANGDFDYFFGVGIDITERKLTQEALKESENKFRDLAEKSLVGIYLIQDGIFKYANPKLAEIFGYTVKELVDKKGPGDLVLQEDWPIVEQNLRKRVSGEITYMDYGFRGVRKDRTVIHAEVHGSRTMYQGRPAVVGTLLDVTERKKTEEEIKRRLMRFRLEDRKLYLVKEPLPTLSVEAFKDLLNVGFRGFAISRTPEEEFRKGIDDNFRFLWVSERGGEKALPPKLQELELAIEGLPSRSAILIDRLDYLVFKNGFEETLAFVQRLREHAYLRGLIVVLSIDPSTLDRRALRLLEKEAAEIEPLHKARLPEDLRGILRFIYGQNTLGIKPSLSEIGTELGVSKPTVRKRIKLLISAGYVIKDTKGRSKVVELTEKGRGLF